MSDSDNEKGQSVPDGDVQDKHEKTMAERAQEVGRDGAYLELDARDLVKAYRNGDLQRAKMVVITSARMDVSDPITLDRLTDYVRKTIDDASGPKPTEDVAGMSDEQLSLFVLQDSLFAGLEGCGCGQ